MLKKLLLIVTILFSSHAMAHPGGHGPVNEDQARAIAENVARRLADEDFGLGFGQLKPSWKELTAGSARVHTRGEGYMIWAVDNKKEGKVLFILMSNNGSVYDVNFTGTFKRLPEPRTEQPQPQ